MVTCNQCIKVKGFGEIGSNWICKDCKVGEYFEVWKSNIYTKNQNINQPKNKKKK